MSKVFQASKGLIRIMQPRGQGLTRITSTTKRVEKVLQHESVTKFSPLSLPVRGLKHQPIQFKKAPMDYPPLTGSDLWKRKVRTYFKCFDVNGDGYITKEDYILSARRCAEYLDLDDERTEHVLNQRIRQWEYMTKNASKVSEEEYVEMVQVLCNQKHFREEFFLAVVSMSFTVTDINGDGLISSEEYKAYFYSLGLSAEASQKAFHLIDNNNDGFITVDEFGHAIAEFFFTEDPSNIYNEVFGALAD
ncbi:sarcoplasmic calcium-binding protein-like [Lingula anatina]|uniref:Sarcoplasmic calcium-binding protein-like n=1 Tax=Lingula anatina TaxID=7574 RepID=A0A1S3IXE8_LINAN|nr:sarcoplasmic calcium-binding protein-like [Lingula anatina]|eukprot:XP_013402651.1 sarcoplasmic calcium-binding protein-like [Lingula anatina]